MKKHADYVRNRIYCTATGIFINEDYIHCILVDILWEKFKIQIEEEGRSVISLDITSQEHIKTFQSFMDWLEKLPIEKFREAVQEIKDRNNIKCTHHMLMYLLTDNSQI